MYHWDITEVSFLNTAACLSVHFACWYTRCILALEWKVVVVCETSHEPPPSPVHLLIINLSVPNLGVQTHATQKEPRLDYRLVSQELLNSVYERLSLYRQQSDGMDCCWTEQHPVTVFLAILCEFWIAIHYAAHQNTILLLLWFHIYILHLDHFHR
jgi:hypothetical protein